MRMHTASEMSLLNDPHMGFFPQKFEDPHLRASETSVDVLPTVPSEREDPDESVLPTFMFAVVLADSVSQSRGVFPQDVVDLASHLPSVRVRTARGESVLPALMTDCSRAQTALPANILNW